MAEAKLKTCKSCNAEIAKSEKRCPKCGAKLKMGLLPKLLIALVGIVILGIALMPSKEEKQASLAAALKEIETAQPSDLSPRGELAAIFNLLSKHTDLQRENKEKEIAGKIVQWSLPVFEVRKLREAVYRIKTSAGANIVGTFITLNTRTDAEKTKIEALKTGDTVSIKERIDGISLRNVEIEDAILVN